MISGNIIEYSKGLHFTTPRKHFLEYLHLKEKSCSAASPLKEEIATEEKCTGFKILL